MNQQILALRQKALELEAEEETLRQQALIAQKEKGEANWNDLVAQIKTLAPYLSDVPITFDKTFEYACIVFDTCVPIYILLEKKWQGEYWTYALRGNEIRFCIWHGRQSADYFGDDIGTAVLAAERYYAKQSKVAAEETPE